jgi:hypothetical protein
MFQDLINSELVNLRDTWMIFTHNLKNTLPALPKEMQSAYDMVVSSLPQPNFNLIEGRKGIESAQILDEMTFL